MNNVHDEELLHHLRALDEVFYKRVEEFAAAFMKQTSLPPSHAVLIVKREYVPESGTILQKIWFEPRNDNL